MESQNPPEEEDEYEQGERILAHHLGQIYEAKILKIEVRDSKKLYYVHYQGWKDRWDEWLDGTRVLKWNENNLKLRQDLRNQIKKNKNATKKKKVEQTDISPKCQIDFPFALRKKLVEDFDYINNQKHLVVLPKSPNVAQILIDFLVEQSDLQVKEVIQGIQEHFDRSVGLSLLYKSERSQYNEMLSKYPTSEPSEIYGIEHLLRSLSKFPIMLSLIDIHQQALEIIKNTISDLLRFIEEHIIKYPSQYEVNFLED